MADREAMGRPLPGRRVHAGPVVAPEDFAEQDPEVGDEALREPANAVAGRVSTARRPARYRTVHGPPHPHGRAATPGKPRNQYSGPKLGYAFVHTVIDDHSRVAYPEVHNEMAHGDFHVEATAQDSEEILAFMGEVLGEVYQRPARVAARRAERQKRKNAKKSDGA